MVAALKLETRGDPVRVLVVVLLGGDSVSRWGDLRVVLWSCYTAARED
jgi:hypothetical protein